MNDVFNNYLSESEISSINRSELRHPVDYLLEEDGDWNQKLTTINTSQALKKLKNVDSNYLSGIKQDILSNDRTSSSAAFGEIRCYANLLECFGNNNVKHVKTKKDEQTPDFCVDYNGTKINIEVNTIQMNGKEAKELNNFYKNSKQSQGASMRVTKPFGNPKVYSTTETVIRKLYNIKACSDQFNKKDCNILWVDLQEEYILGIVDRLVTNKAYFSGAAIGSGGACDGIYSNEIWYSLYSNKGDLVFEGFTMNSGEGNVVKKKHLMNYCGKFADKKYSKIDAVIFSSPERITIYENPYAHHKIPKEALIQITSMRRFSIEASIFGMNKRDIKRMIKNERKNIKSLSKCKFYSW